MAESDESYANIRNPNLLGDFIGKRVVEITQHDREEFEEDGRSYVQLHFEDGSFVKFYISDEPFEIHWSNDKDDTEGEEPPAQEHS